jgi:diguanylate cyclase (GGDEF)-like protein/PAS domain S-box-containing protein
VRETTNSRPLPEELHEVTDRERTLEALRQQSQAIRASLDGMAVLDASQEFVFVNEAHAHLYGYDSPDELVGKTWRVLYGPEELSRLERDVIPVLFGEGRWSGEAVGRRRDGTEFPQELSLSVLESGGLVCVVRDIAQRRKAEEALRESEEKYRAIYENIQDGYYEVDLRGNLTFFNDALCRILGCERRELMGGNNLRFSDAENASKLYETVTNVYRTGVPARYVDWEVLRQDGSPAHVAASVSLIRDAQGRPTGFRGVISDVTERKRAERELEESAERYRRVVELSPLAIAIHSEGKLVFVNRAGAELLGAESPDELMMRPALDFVHPDYRSLVQERMEGLRQGNEAPVMEEKFLRLDGSAVDVEVAAMPFTFMGRPAVQVVARDITERKHVEALQSALYRIAQAVTSADDMADFYRAIHQIVGELIDARNFYIALQDPVTGALSFPYFVDERDEVPPAVKPGKTLTEYVLRTGQPLLAWPATFAELLKRGEVEMVGSPSVDWLGVPLKRGERAFGVLVLQSYTKSVRFTPQDLNIVTVVSQHVAAALERLRADEALRESEATQRALLDAIPDLMFRLRRDGTFLDFNAPDAQELMVPPSQFLGRRIAQVWPPDMAGPAMESLERAFASRRTQTYEYKLDVRGEMRHYEGRIAVCGSDEALLIVRDISERKRAEEQIRNLAYHDGLTGLPNRILFNDRLTIAVAQAHRHGHRLAVLFLDVDRFKLINDSLGHSLGDRLLQGVAERLKGCVREGDTVARLGGDEFTLLLPEITRALDVVNVAEKILEAVKLPFRLEGRELFVSASMGISLYPDDGVNAETLVKNADAAMYRAKEQGRDNYRLYAPAMNATALERLALESSLRKALSQGELVVYYQPLVDLRIGRVHGVEALLRWRHPERGLMAPSDFIPLAELTGQILAMGPWVLRTACAQVKYWHERGHGDLSVAVNISARQFQQPDLVAQVKRALRDTGLDPRYLDLEITESNAMQNAEATVQTLRELKDIGVRISIDDFGIGYSSLSYLKRLPIDTLKIDQSFVRDITVDPDDAAIATAVIAMAHTLKLKVVAEGVETEGQGVFLAARHCDRMQGYLFSAPLPPDECEEFLGSDRWRT